MAIDLSLLSAEQLDKYLHVQAIVARQKEEQDRVRALRDYYDGEHPVFLTERQKEYLGRDLTSGHFAFSHNTIKSVVDTLRERLSVSGFTVNDAGMDDDHDPGNDGAATPAAQLAATLWNWWEENRLDAQQIRVHRRALRDGKSYIMVDYDIVNERPRFTLHQVDDGVTGITYHRDPENPERVLFANKYWYTYNPLSPGQTGTERKTTYLPGEVRKYIKHGGLWQRYADEDNGVWPLPWVDENGQPLGIPLFEFENPGGSEVAQLIGLQNVLNKAWLDLVAAADTAGFPILSIEYAQDETFKPEADDDDIEGDDEFIVAPGRALEVHGGRIHRIEGADLSQLISAINLTVETIAGISRTPQYYLRPTGGAQVPSGESLKQLESGLITRAIERQLIFGQTWADAMSMAYKVARAFGSVALPIVPKLKVQTLWANPATRDEKFDAETAEIHKRLGVPDDELWTKLGYSPEQIASFKRRARSEQAATIATVAQAWQGAQQAIGNREQPSNNRTMASNPQGENNQPNAAEGNG